MTNQFTHIADVKVGRVKSNSRIRDLSGFGVNTVIKVCACVVVVEYEANASKLSAASKTYHDLTKACS